MREAALGAFLHGRSEAGWRRHRLPGDASRRGYWRLEGPGSQSAIVMDAPPESGERIAPFVRIAHHLTGLGLAAPIIRAVDEENGFLLLEDLGPETLASSIDQKNSDEAALYAAAAAILGPIQAATPPDSLSSLDQATAGEMIKVFCDWALPVPAHAGASNALAIAVAESYDRHVGTGRVLSLRDYHAENLIWRPNLPWPLTVGLLDFQDAFLAPPVYDLASLVSDPRRDVSPEAAQAAAAAYCRSCGQEADLEGAELACVSLQRNLRIAGIFHRLIRQDGKTRYAAFLPRLSRLIARDLVHPGLKGVARAVASLPGQEWIA